MTDDLSTKGETDGATPRPWATLLNWPRHIAREDERGKTLGASIYEEQDRENYAVVIAEAPANVTSGFAHEIPEAEARANARLIVLAVNSHDALVEALAAFLGEDDRFDIAIGGNPIAVDRMLARARSALSLARGQTPGDTP